MTGAVDLAAALDKALSSITTRPEDTAAVALARRYATAIDAAPDVLAELGPKLLAVLVELGMTPRARAAVLGKGGPGGRAERSKLDELRERRAAWQHGATAVDTTAPVADA